MDQTDVISAVIQEEVIRTTEALRGGKVILYPTDTVWGLGCDITNKSAVERVREIKQRPTGQPFISLVSSLRMLKRYVSKIHPRVETLLAYHTKPLTIIYKQVKNLPDHMIAQDGSTAIRICTDPFCQAVIERFGRPIVSTSANIASQPFPRNFQEIEPFILKEVDFLVDYRQEETEEQFPSVIATYNHKGELRFIRE